MKHIKLYEEFLNEDAFRRIVITSTKTKDITKEILKFAERVDIKQDYPVKLKVTPGVQKNTIVIDISGSGATVMGTKLSDLAKKLDKTAIVKTKTEIKRVPVKENKMNKLDLQKLIREEIKKALKEADTDSIADQYYLALENVESFKRLGMDGQGELIALIVKHLAKQGIK